LIRVHRISCNAAEPVWRGNAAAKLARRNASSRHTAGNHAQRKQHYDQIVRRAEKMAVDQLEGNEENIAELPVAVQDGDGHCASAEIDDLLTRRFRKNQMAIYQVPQTTVQVSRRRGEKMIGRFAVRDT
jgi:hypothetical protein